DVLDPGGADARELEAGLAGRRCVDRGEPPACELHRHSSRPRASVLADGTGSPCVDPPASVSSLMRPPSGCRGWSLGNTLAGRAGAPRSPGARPAHRSGASAVRLLPRDQVAVARAASDRTASDRTASDRTASDRTVVRPQRWADVAEVVHALA